MRRLVLMLIFCTGVTACDFPGPAFWRAAALTELALAQHQAGDLAGAREAAVLALEAADAVEENPSRHYANHLAVTAGLRGDPKLALALIESLDDPNWLIYALSAVDLGRPDLVAQIVERPAFQRWAVEWLPNAATREPMIDALREAFIGDPGNLVDSVAAIPNAETHKLILTLAAVVRVRTGNPDAAVEIWRTTRPSTGSYAPTAILPHEESKANWGWIDLIASGVAGGWKRYVWFALASSNLTDIEPYLLGIIGAAYVKKGDVEKALRLVDEFDDISDLTWPRLMIAEALIHSEHPELATDIAREILDGFEADREAPRPILVRLESSIAWAILGEAGRALADALALIRSKDGQLGPGPKNSQLSLGLIAMTMRAPHDQRHVVAAMRSLCTIDRSGPCLASWVEALSSVTVSKAQPLFDIDDDKRAFMRLPAIYAQLQAGEIETARVEAMRLIGRTETARGRIRLGILHATLRSPTEGRQVEQDSIVTFIEDAGLKEAAYDLIIDTLKRGYPSEAMIMTSVIRDSWKRSLALCDVAMAFVRYGDPVAARRALEEVDSLVSNPSWRAVVIAAQAQVHLALGEASEADMLLSRALAAAREIRDEPDSKLPRDEAYRALAVALAAVGRVHEAEDQAERIAHPYARARALRRLALAQAAGGRVEDAKATARAYAALARELVISPITWSLAAQKVVALYRSTGLEVAAVEIGREFAEQGFEFRSPELAARILARAARILAESGEDQEARTALHEARTRLSAIGQNQWRALAAVEVGLAEAALGDVAAARGSSERAGEFLDPARTP